MPMEPEFQILAERVDFRCCGAGCYSSVPLNEGTAVQIGSPLPEEPRYDRWLSPEKALWLQNYVWLCHTCAAKVERDPVTHTSDELQDWKDTGEAVAETLHMETIEKAKAIVEAAPRSRSLRIFLSHASEDKAHAKKLAGRLAYLGYSPWLDDSDLAPGDEWREHILQMIDISDLFVVLLSRALVAKQGFVQEEIQFALTTSRRRDRAFIIPLKLEQCEIPVALQPWQCGDIFTELGEERFMRALRARAVELTSKTDQT
jgi:hypothetical protein